MRRFLLGWKTLGHEQRLRAKIINYADDFVICCRGTADQAMLAMRDMMQELKLTVNDEKTHIRRLPDEHFDFLGYTFGRYYSRKHGWRYLGNGPSRTKVQAICRRISELTDRKWCWLDSKSQVARLNRLLRGWANYFYLGAASQAFRTITRHTCRRLRRWLAKKHKVKNRGYTRYSDIYLLRELGLLDLTKLLANLPWAKA